MWKLIFIGLIVWLAYHIVKRIIIQSGGNKHPDINQDNANDQSELMVKCTKCAVHLPRSEAYMIADKFYCSKEHLPEK